MIVTTPDLMSGWPPMGRTVPLMMAMSQATSSAPGARLNRRVPGFRDLALDNPEDFNTADRLHRVSVAERDVVGAGHVGTVVDKDDVVELHGRSTCEEVADAHDVLFDRHRHEMTMLMTDTRVGDVVARSFGVASHVDVVGVAPQKLSETHAIEISAGGRNTDVKQIVGPRVTLRRWQATDRMPFAEMNADHEVMKYFPSPLGLGESNDLIDRAEASLESNGFGLWALEVHGKFVGFTGCSRVTFPSPVESRIEVGWRLARSAWGNGYVTEAAGLCIDDVFGRLRVDAIVSFTTSTNLPSESVMKRLKMQRREDLDFDHPRTPGWWGQRHIVYEMQSRDWKSLREAGE